MVVVGVDSSHIGCLLPHRLQLFSTYCTLFAYSLNCHTKSTTRYHSSVSIFLAFFSNKYFHFFQLLNFVFHLFIFITFPFILFLFCKYFSSFFFFYKNSEFLFVNFLTLFFCIFIYYSENILSFFFIFNIFR